MGRKRKIPLSYTARPWYRGEISSSDSDENPYLPRPKLPKNDDFVLPSDVPSEPESHHDGKST